MNDSGIPKPPSPIEVLHADSDLFVLNKPSGTWTQGGPADQPSALHQLRQIESADNETITFFHPLESDISGLILAARNTTVRDQLQIQFTEKRLTFTYLAIVRGTLLAESGIMDRPISTSGKRADRNHVDHEHGQPARTEWRLRDSFVGFALLECTPCTEIPGQIRIHLEDAGLPLAVDHKHGGADHLMLSSFKAGYRRSRRRPERPLIRRPTLHAWRITLEHPTRNEPLQFEAPLPKDLRATLHQLDRFARIPK
ncbi:MAG: RluA family pseudouridine synthase [Phycisphaerae bacterium]